MTPGRLLQVLGLGIVTVVMIRSYMVSDMLFQFGGLALGAAVFMLGRSADGPRDA